MITTRDSALRNALMFVRDTNTKKITRVIIPGDLQIGLRGNPAALELGGKLAINVTDYSIDAQNKGIINARSEDTVVSLTVEVNPDPTEVNVFLPASPSKGQLHFIKDSSGFASSGFPINILPQEGLTIDGSTSKQIVTAFGSTAVFWFGGQWRVLVAGVGGSGGAPINSTYVTLTNDATLTNERKLEDSANIELTDGGANSNLTLDLTDTGVGASSYTAASITVDAKGRITSAFSNVIADSNASYIVISATGSLPNARQLIAGPNIVINDQGTQVAITGSTGAGDPDARYVVTELTGSLPNSFVIEAGPNITINSGSGIISITGSAGGDSPDADWVDEGNALYTTSSVAIGVENPASDEGTDITFFVSGAISGSEKSVFGGDVHVSGTLFASTSVQIINNEIKSTDELRFFDTSNSDGPTLTELRHSGSGDGFARYVISESTSSLPNAFVLTQGPNITINSGSGILSITGSAPDGDNQARYVVTEPTGSLPNSFVVVAGPNITINSGSGLLSITGSTSATDADWTDAGNALYTTSSVAIGVANVASDEGTDIFFFVSGSLDGTEKSVFGGDVHTSGTVTSESGFSGSLTTLADGTPFLLSQGSITLITTSLGQVIISGSGAGGGGGESGGDGGDSQPEYIVNAATASLPNALKLEAGPNITINSGSGILSITGSACDLKDVRTLQFLAGVETTATALVGSKESIGSIFFDPSEFASTAEYKWRFILRTSEIPVPGAIDIYDQDGIVGGLPGIITGSIASSSNQSLTNFEIDLTSQLSSVTGSGIFEARIWKTISGSTTSSISSAHAKLDVETSGSSALSQPYTFQILSGIDSTNSALSGSKQSVGAFFFDPAFVSGFSGIPTYTWKTIIRTSEVPVEAAIDLYDQNGIISGLPGIITGSILSSSNQAFTNLESDITSQLTNVTGSGVIEARIWKTISGSVTSSITSAAAKIDVEFS